jgi:hypothetical protein
MCQQWRKNSQELFTVVMIEDDPGPDVQPQSVGDGGVLGRSTCQNLPEWKRAQPFECPQAKLRR